ncbi:6376_t:CDS:1, partial [Ambispora leptoticha]
CIGETIDAVIPLKRCLKPARKITDNTSSGSNIFKERFLQPNYRFTSSAIAIDDVKFSSLVTGKKRLVYVPSNLGELNQ